MSEAYLKIEIRHMREFLRSVETHVNEGSPLKQACRNIGVALTDAYNKHEAQILAAVVQEQIEELY
jgi:type II secretory pathway component PulF